MRIAVIGSGISGVTLALRLQQLGIDSTIFSEKTPDELRSGRLMNTVARFEHTLERERMLDVDHWSDTGNEMTCIHLRSIDPLALSFTGHARHAVRAVDFRVLLPTFLEDFVARGGDLVVERPLDAARSAHGFDLAVVAVGRTSIDTLFPVDAARSPYAQPQRLLFAGIVDGLALPDPLGLSFNIAPGAGEVFQMPIWTNDGPATNILIEAIPGGPLSAVGEVPVEDASFVPMLLELLDVHVPAIADRIDRKRFGVRSPSDSLHGAVTPAVRDAYAVLPDGTPALAIGDAWITNDPITGQGANIGSHCAWVAADHIARGGTFDLAWGRRVEEDMWSFAGPVTAWTNGFLRPPPPHVVELLLAAAADQDVADAFVTGFGDPARFAIALATPESTADFVRSASTVPAAG